MARLLTVAACLAAANIAVARPTVIDAHRDVTYEGLDRNGIEVFLNIPYGRDTGGEHRFKPPQLYVPEPGTTIEADAYGPACPQALGEWVLPLSLSNVTHVSEDCLNLNIARPKRTCPSARLPVMVYIHGGSFWSGQNQEITIRPDGMVLESVENGLPIIHVAMNYRLGAFGFAQSDALRDEGSENAGLRDQRLAIEWVRDNIAHFGGDPKKITIFGQSSGGLSIGMQIMAYGGSQPVPFQQGIFESQALEPGITRNFTIDAMDLLVDHVGCNASGSLHSRETVECLRALDMQTMLDASIETYASDIAHNIGDIWLPTVDGDFLPDAPSRLVREHRFARDVTTMMGWCEDDVSFFTDTTIATADDTRDFLSSYVPGVTPANMDKLLSLYPVSEFPASPEEIGLSGEFWRAARIFRDILMACEPIWYGEHLAAADGTGSVYVYTWNQTMLGPALEATSGGQTGWGTIHTSEFAYTFGNLSHYDIHGWAFDPTEADRALLRRGSRSWSTFAATAKPGLEGKETFQGFRPSFESNGEGYLFVAGGPNEGISPFGGPDAHPVVGSQKLTERCEFINSDEMIEQLGF